MRYGGVCAWWSEDRGELEVVVDETGGLWGGCGGGAEIGGKGYGDLSESFRAVHQGDAGLESWGDASEVCGEVEGQVGWLTKIGA